MDVGVSNARAELIPWPAGPLMSAGRISPVFAWVVEQGAGFVPPPQRNVATPPFAVRWPKWMCANRMELLKVPLSVSV